MNKDQYPKVEKTLFNIDQYPEVEKTLFNMNGTLMNILKELIRLNELKQQEIKELQYNNSR